MSVMFAARKKRPALSSQISERDMSKKQKVHRKVQQLSEDGKVKITKAWNVELADQTYRVSFSRDNLHVWINGQAQETTCYITDKGYDVDLFFTLGDVNGHIYSDVEGMDMFNYLLIDGTIVAEDYQAVS